MTLKQPLPFSKTAELDIQWDWTEWAAGTSSAIASFTLTVPSGITVIDSLRVGAVITAWVKLTDPGAAVLGADYEIACNVVTGDATPRKDSRVFKLVVAQRGAGL